MVRIVGVGFATLILITGVTWYVLSTNGRIETLQSSQTRLRGDLTATQTELGATTEELSSTRGELSSTKQGLVSTQETLATTQGDLASTQIDLTTTKSNLTSAQKELSSTREELTTTASSLFETQRELTTTVTSLFRTQRDLARTQRELATTDEKLSATRNSLEATQSDLASTQGSLTSTQRELGSTRRDLNLTQQDLDAARQELSRSVSSEAALRSKVSNLESQVFRLERDVQSLDTQLNPPPASLAAYPNGEWVEYYHPDVASKIGGLAWVRDGTSALEESAVEELINTATYTSPEAASELTSYSWVRDGISQVEVDAIDAVNDSGHEEVTLKTAKLRWVRDGITSLEVETLQNLGWITWSEDDSQLPIEAAVALLSKKWMIEGIDPLEADIVDVLSDLATATWEESSTSSIRRFESEDILRILRMPFLETVEAHDVHVVRALYWLAFEPDHFEQVLSHPRLEAGITDKLAPIVVALGGATPGYNYVDVLLGSDTHVENLTVSTMMSEQVDVTIVRVGSRNSTSLTTLSETVQEIEEYMGVALPTNHIILFYDPSDIDSDIWAGLYHGSHISARDEYDKGDSGFNPGLLAHEVTHYYFHSGPGWIHEGIADTLQILIPRERTRSRSVVEAQNSRHECTIRNLKSLEDYDGTDQGWCSYYLGEKLFVDLYKALGEIDFRRALRTLYRLSEQEELDISHIREVFGTSPRVLRIINRHYDGS